MMNKKAKALNLFNTNFVTPHGLDNEKHFTTALDLAILSDYAMQNEIFANIVNTKSFTILINNHSKTISNTNELLGNYKGLYGIKTGFTNGANRCLVTACKRGSLDFICVVLGCDTKKNRTLDSINLLDYAFNNYSLFNVEKFIREEFDKWYVSHRRSFYINKGKSQELNLSLNENDFIFSNIAVKNTEKENFYVEIFFNSYLNAPISEYTQIGKIVLFNNNKAYYSVSIQPSNKINKKYIFDYLSYFIKNYFYFFAKSPI